MKSKTKCSLFLILINIILTFSVLHPVNSNSGLAKGKAEFPPFLEGVRIDILDAWRTGVDEISLPADDNYYVIHGFSMGWEDEEPSDRRAFLQEGTRFELYLNGEKVELRKWMHHYQFRDTPALVQMKKLHYIQFEPDQFSIDDTIVFTGLWYYYGILEIEYTLTVTFF